jgi:hypothetical protein
MSRFVVPVRLLTLVVAAAVLAPNATSAATAEEFLNAPVWYLQYEVSFKSTHQGTSPSPHGSMSFTSSLERVFSASDALNLRSQGPGAITMGAMYGGTAGKQPSVAEAQEMTMRMMAQMDHTANWMAGGAAADPNATDAELEASVTASTTPSSPARLDYTRVDVGKHLVDETGGKYDTKRTTTVKGTAQVLTVGMGSYIFEMDTAAKTYLLTLPLGFSGQSAMVTSQSVTFTQSEGTPGIETRESDEMPFDRIPSGLALDAPPEGSPQGAVLLRGTLDPAKGHISGEISLPAHYDENNSNAPGTLVIKYTLAITPPAKK